MVEASATFDAQTWAAVPFGFWAVVFFVFGTIVGSFLNVCIHRMPREESIVSPPSHCPHCRYSIPWYLNIPLVTWLYLGGKCRNCGAPISVRYFLVELLTGVLWLGSWLTFGHDSVALAIVLAVFMSGLVVATFIDLEHFIIPDEITIGGIVVGFICSFLVPVLQRVKTPGAAMGSRWWASRQGRGLFISLCARASWRSGGRRWRCRRVRVWFSRRKQLCCRTQKCVTRTCCIASRTRLCWRRRARNGATGVIAMCRSG